MSSCAWTERRGAAIGKDPVGRADRIVIVGGGRAAASAIDALRKGGFEGSVTLVGEELALPYERPPLSKGLLLGAMEPEKTGIRDRAHYEERGVELRLGRRAVRIDRAGRNLILADGNSVAYDRLLLATGARARRLSLPGATLPGIHYLRSLEDSLALRGHLEPGARIAILGGGYIGLEVAASARKRGCVVTVVERQPAVLQRVIDPAVGAIVSDYHRAAGIVLLLGTGVAAFQGRNKVEAVVLEDGGDLPVDAVLVGIGAEPAVGLAEDAGLAMGDGILVDEGAKTSDPAIFAAGDVADHPNPSLGRRLRLESWQHAQHQAVIAAANMLGGTQIYDEVPWFWSDQYDLNIQMVGLTDHFDRVVLRGDPAERRFAAFYLWEERMVAAVAVNAPREIRPARQLIQMGLRLAPAKLADPETELRSLIV